MERPFQFGSARRDKGVLNVEDGGEEDSTKVEVEEGAEEISREEMK